LKNPGFWLLGLIYHPHSRPVSTLPATVIDLSASIQKRLPVALQAKTLSSSLNTLALFSPLLASLIKSKNTDLAPFSESIANLLSIPPVHVDSVAESVCRLIEGTAADQTFPSVVGVKEMRRLIGFKDGTESESDNATVDANAV